MANLSMRAMLEAGAHFGHQTQRWNPKMAPFIFGARNGIYILDLTKTQTCAQTAYERVRDLAAKGEAILFVGTKKQAADIVREEAERCGMFHVTHRWLGGTLTNFTTIRNSIKRLTRLDEMLGNEQETASLTKKEVARLTKERDKLQRNLGGIRDMGKLPAAVFIVDTLKESIAVAEASRLGIESVAMCDTNSDPETVTYPLPSNDDAIRSIRLFASFVADAVIDGKAAASEGAAVPAPAEEAPAAEAGAPVTPPPTVATVPAEEAPAAAEAPATEEAATTPAPTESAPAEPAPEDGGEAGTTDNTAS